MVRYFELLILRTQLFCDEIVRDSSRVYGSTGAGGEQRDLREVVYSFDLKSVDLNRISFRILLSRSFQAVSGL